MRKLLPSLVLLIAGCAGAATTRDFRLSDLRLVGCRVAGERVVLDRWFDQGASAVIGLEAEAAVDLLADPPDGQAEAECSGGRSVVKLDRALFPVNITKPGRYVRWLRGFFPQGGGWVHSESLDFSAPQWHTDCDGATAGRWVWVKGPAYDLTAGVHLFWLHNWHGGARLDKVLFAPEGVTPEGIGPQAAPVAPAQAGWAATSVLPVPGLKTVTAASWPVLAEPDAATVSLSLDGGQTTHALGPGTVPLDASAPLAAVTLRADLRRAASGTSPALGAPRVSYETDPRALVTLEDERVRATFVRATGGLAAVYDKIARTECLQALGTAPPCALSRLASGATGAERIPADQMQLTGLTVRDRTLTATYVVPGDLALRLQVTLAGGQLTWTLDVDNRSAVDLVDVCYPLLPGWRLGERSADDSLMVPQWQGGVETTDPVRAGGDGVRYPTGGAMCWLDLYERQPAHGVYLTGHDPTLTGCALSASPDRETDSLTFSLTRWVRIKPGQRWQGPPVVVGLHEGDWHRAADAYRTWAQTWMHQPTPPEWVREADGWYGLVASANSSRVPFRRFPEYLARARELGTNYLQVWGQMTGGNNCDALPYPNPLLGTLDEFKAAIREIRRQGGHITFYVSSQFWRVDYGAGEMLGTTPRALLPPGVPTWNWDEWRNYALRGADGSYSGDTELTPEQQARYGTRWLRTILCPWTEAWAKRHLQYWTVEQYAQRYGASGIYLDETCAAAERVCYATNHGHQHPGIWGQSLARAMQAMVAGGRQVDPDWTFAMEGCGDAIGQFADMNLISPASAKKPGQWGANRRFAPECFHYTFPEYILYDGVANGMYGKTQEDCFLDVHLHGNRFDSFSVEPARPYVQLRQRTKQLLYRATFRDDRDVTSSDPAVRAKLNTLTDAANELRLINLANPQHRAATVQVAVSQPSTWAAYYFDLEGKEGPLALERRADGVSFAAPTSRAATVLVFRRCEPLVRVTAASLVAGDQGAVSVVVTNPTTRPISGTLTLDRGLFGQKPPVVKVTLPARQTRTVALPVTVPVGAPRACTSGHVVFVQASGTVRRPCDLLVTSPFACSGRLRGDRVELTLTNLTHVVQTGKLVVTSPALAAAPPRSLTLPPAGQTTLALPLAAGFVALAPLNVETALTCGAETDRQTLWLRPLALNGAFDEPSVGGRPAEWNYQNAQQATRETVDGNPCLRLAGQPGLFVEADQALPTETGKTYEVRCRMKRTAGAGGRVGPSVVLFPASGPERYVDLQKVTDQPDEEWNDYRVRFTMDPAVARALLYLYNVSSPAVAWFDDVQVSEVEP